MDPLDVSHALDQGSGLVCDMIDQPSITDLIKKYDVPTPRYTSYPTVPSWNTEDFSEDEWRRAAKRTFDESNDSKGISVYIHLPFCESLCTYCACNKRITKNHDVEIGYIRSLLNEWNQYIDIFGRKPLLRELHLGGGTPTFFSPKNLKWLVSWLLEEGIVHDDREFSFEGHPNNTTYEHLGTLHELGFRRVSFGVQDLDPTVQKAINRIQPFQNLERVTTQSRAIGYTSVSFDLVYGLPHQTVGSVEHTINKVLKLKPDRVAFYSYAHVPWVSPAQRGYSEADLPSEVNKRNLYEAGRRILREHGYNEIGMDHFALSHDELFKAQESGHLHRNFMGYTTTQTDLLIGLGTSAISDAKYAYAQNVKKVEDYTRIIGEGRLPLFKGHLMTAEDMVVKRSILNISCKGLISNQTLEVLKDDESITHALSTMLAEGIVIRDPVGYRVTPTGRTFIRNVCSIFDKRLKSSQTDASGTPVFSKAI